ncbi:hypothetical protein MMC29_005433 [Sticta canariensis]|nr:hypothetical protein [Sticta canariensis]
MQLSLRTGPVTQLNPTFGAGVSDRGQLLIKEMNWIGMLVDLSHKSNSVVMVNLSPDFLSGVASNGSSGLRETVKANATLAQIASDYDGIEEVPTGLADVSRFPDLIAGLLKRGVSDGNVIKLLGGNVLRVWAEADKVAAKMQKYGVLPVEDTIKSEGAIL